MHTLALALLAKDEEMHYFRDIGYEHPPFQHCPKAGVGCECSCDPDSAKEVDKTCLIKMRAGPEPS